MAQTLLRLSKEIKEHKIKQDEEERQNNEMKKSTSVVYMSVDERIMANARYKCFAYLEIKILKYYQKMLIEPNNKRLKWFHLGVAISLVCDFLLSGFIFSNYDFHMHQENNEFLDHRDIYFFICWIQAMEIFLNFLKIEISPTRRIDDPLELFENYIKGSFIVDVIAMFPYSVYKSELIFLRFIKIVNFNRYLGYFTNIMIEMLQYILENSQVKIVISIFKLLF